MSEKEKLEEAKRLYQTANADQKYVLESLFPELKESDDERIRQALIEYFTTSDNNSYYAVCGVATKKILAWLEKQAEKDKLIQELGKYKVKYTQEVLEKHINGMNKKDDERLRKTTIAFLKDFADKGYENAVECIDWLEKQGEHSETSEETPKCNDTCIDDERIRKSIITALENCKHIISVDLVTRERMLAWLEKQGNKTEEHIFRPIAGSTIDNAARQAINKATNGENIVFSFNGFYMKIYKDTTIDNIINSYNDFCKKQGMYK